jgi:hypothetical protein
MASTFALSGYNACLVCRVLRRVRAFAFNSCAWPSGFIKWLQRGVLLHQNF